ncbi:aminopeptidase P family protein [Acidomonas methanolica]|uniref:Xaa-Pro aminopeptidase n=1 Tax=Acidomonas methanolica NBRC 104435 TaxID=1231351 RepID=A0A023D1F9_ACIMT|nr:aminopeptidase P family protein [Acidomonas methanolica]MBU2652857.1 aminopeptidase P family protein [Acidomonas methanolica]TCS31261.1 Xaa-Pro aminopeptidase [Acidomonas methanolica]GAJ27972.1 Xaa-Pro aminopeptidase [Acidomonas methanolica NBRC 104435]GBQ48394.1 Xaa-Pro aminopeptidase [Acidomonas methanolica]GEK98491.1 Xaa-Pro aminopeptidase [Acidomonas methanolica NBRC 104435]
MTAMSPAGRVARLRAELSRLGVDGFVLPRGDEFLGEYVAPYAERLAWLTGFTGSAGLAIVLPDRAAVFSDGRYTVQLAEQTDETIWERRHLIQSPPREWLKAHAQGVRIGYDPRLVSEAGLDALTVPGVEMVPLAENPVDAVWEDRPAPPASMVAAHPESLSGESSVSKRRRIAEILRAAHENAALIADTTALAWLLNIRGDDVPHIPVVLAFALLHDDAGVDLFLDEARIPVATRAFLGDDIRLHPPAALEGILAGLAGKTVRVDPNGGALWFIRTLEAAGATVSRAADPCALPKARKNAVEQDGARAVHLHDSAALCRFLHFVSLHGVGLGETALAERLDRFRALHPAYRGESFPAISAVGPNAALPHYRAIPGQDRLLTPDTIYLIDSGGQYPQGTTDVTRTIWTGPDPAPTMIREAYTRVLKGNIALNRARFPFGAPGHRLDALARQFLWQDGLDYDHGTGHGIGSYLSVHEGPQNISSVARPVGLEPGMIVSDEPGYYEMGQYGIRLENLLLVRPAPVGAPGRFLEFETLGHVPFDRSLIVTELLQPDERAWLRAYHERTLEMIGPLLDDAARAWLEKACAPLG